MEGEEGPCADMEALVRRLRLHRAAPSPYEPSGAVAPAPGTGELFRPRRAAVLVCLFRGAAGELRVILTKRSSSFSTHSGLRILPGMWRRKYRCETGGGRRSRCLGAMAGGEARARERGEVALPGGKAEENDADDAATALRESKEEIGLDPALVTIVTSLEHFLSKHLLVVVPVVGILSDVQAFKPVLNVAEVDEIFDVPLDMFLKDENRTSDDLEWMGQPFTLHHFSYEKGNKKYIIWGLTAGILIHAASVCIPATTGLS